MDLKVLVWLQQLDCGAVYQNHDKVQSELDDQHNHKGKIMNNSFHKQKEH